MSKSCAKEQQQSHNEGSIRHAEKRRTSSCLFADRVARVSRLSYVERVPEAWRNENKQICLATFVAHFEPTNDTASVPIRDGGHLQVMALGVGTKYLSEDVISSEKSSGSSYGERIRDLHAEVLARRAFRRKLLLEMKMLSTGEGEGMNNDQDVDHKPCRYRPILRKQMVGENVSSNKANFALADGVTIHMYTSSTPCGNSSLKKFAKMAKEKYNTTLGPDEWLKDPHIEMPPHSIHLGSFSLLVKKGYSSKTDETSKLDLSHLPKKQRSWPAYVSDDWCPPGTSLPHFGKGSIHSCSDKICRWNNIGLQGSLLSSLLAQPLYMTSLTIGRKFTRTIAQRAVCCRAIDHGLKKITKRKRGSDDGEEKQEKIVLESGYKLNHPSVMGTGVYLDDSGVIDMSGEKTVGQDVRFLSNLCWIWCPDNDEDEKFNAECLDGDTGFIHAYNNASTTEETNSMYSSASFTKTFLDVFGKRWFIDDVNIDGVFPQSLDQFRNLKIKVSPKYEAKKDALLNSNKVFSQWNRRQGKQKTFDLIN